MQKKNTGFHFYFFQNIMDIASIFISATMNLCLPETPCGRGGIVDLIRTEDSSWVSTSGFVQFELNKTDLLNLDEDIRFDIFLSAVWPSKNV